MPDDLGLPDWVSEPGASLAQGDDAPVVRRSDRRRGEREQRGGHQQAQRREESQEQWRRERRELRSAEPSRSRGDRRTDSVGEATSPLVVGESAWLTRSERRRRAEREIVPNQSASRGVRPVEMVPPTQQSAPETRSLRRPSSPGPRPSRITFARRRAVAALALTTTLALLLWSFWPSQDRSPSERANADLAAAALSQKSDPAPAAEDLPTARAATPDGGATPAPQSGTGKVLSVALPTIAAPQLNPNRTVRVGLEVESGAGVNAAQAAAIVSSTLGDKRGWQTRDQVRFRAVSPAAVAAGDVDITIVLASPDLTDKLCAPLRTRGQVSCFNLRKVVLNVRRWTEGVPGYGTNLAAYREYMVNHEIGHGLYHGHVECPRKGAPAPIMLQQSKGLDGCLQNPWPTVG
ncbi:DUF3152 domain-containing protein [Knoellia sp. S7-12]|uniref:DUF3152 domain-containing protein n=1 Tax=Knoellia sp. S7-12 TaxID=3126698 RepID=UPI003367475D